MRRADASTIAHENRGSPPYAKSATVGQASPSERTAVQSGA